MLPPVKDLSLEKGKKNYMLFWVCKETQFLQKVARGQALHFRAVIQIWGGFKLALLVHLLFCYKTLSLLLLNPENKLKLKSWLKQPNQIVSYWSGLWWQGKQACPSEDVIQHSGGVTPQPGGITQIRCDNCCCHGATAVHSQLWGSGTIFRPWVRLSAL